MKLSSLGAAASVAFLLAGIAPLASQSTVNYHLIQTVPLPQAPGNREYFDYLTVDADARRVYVTHGTEVDVINADDYSLIGRIGGLQLSHGVVILKELGKGFVTDGEAKKVISFDLNTLKVTGEVATDQPDTDALVYDPASKYLFSINGNSRNLTVIDPVKEAAVKMLDLGGAAEFGVVDGAGTLFDNNEEKSDMAVIDTRALAIRARWSVVPAGTAVALAIDPKNRRLFSAGRNPQFLVMMDADNGRVLQSFPISAGVDAAAFEPETGLVLVSTREGMLHIFHEDSPDKLSEVQTVKTEYGAKKHGARSQDPQGLPEHLRFRPAASPHRAAAQPAAAGQAGQFPGAGLRALRSRALTRVCLLYDAGLTHRS